jgi:hypothetical protein
VSGRSLPCGGLSLVGAEWPGDNPLLPYKPGLLLAPVSLPLKHVGFADRLIGAVRTQQCGEAPEKRSSHGLEYRLVALDVGRCQWVVVVTDEKAV